MGTHVKSSHVFDMERMKNITPIQLRSDCVVQISDLPWNLTKAEAIVIADAVLAYGGVAAEETS